MWSLWRTLATLALLAAMASSSEQVVNREPQPQPQLQPQLQQLRLRTPKLVTLPVAKPCESDTFCGGEADVYPMREIQEILQETLALQVSEVRDRFFKETVMLRDGFTDSLDQPGCQSHTEAIPRFARAKNNNNTWRFLLQNENAVQHIQVTVCVNAGSACRNDPDSPEEQPGSTVCRQVYSEQRLLAVDEAGDVIVDTFPLPSACQCYFKQNEVGLRQGVPGQQGQAGLAAPGQIQSGPSLCPGRPPQKLNFTTNEARAFQSDPDRVQYPTSRRRRRDDDSINFPTSDEAKEAEAVERIFPPAAPVAAPVGSEAPVASPCKDSTLCDADDKNYPKSQVSSLLRSATALNEPSLFGAAFDASCAMAAADVGTRSGAAPDFGEQSLCAGYKDFMFPKTAQNAHGEWRFIVNVDEHRQGVAVEKCKPANEPESEGVGCTYGGKPGRYPYATKCEQAHSLVNLLAVVNDNLTVEAFRVPSACVCTIVQDEYFPLVEEALDVSGPVK